MKFLFDLLTSGGLRFAFDAIIDRIKEESAKLIEAAADGARKLVIVYLLSLFLVGFILIGFVLIHLGLFFILPWSPATKGSILLLLGVLYLSFGMAFVVVLTSKKGWLKSTGAQKAIDELRKK